MIRKIALEEHFMAPDFVDYWSTTFGNISPELSDKALGAWRRKRTFAPKVMRATTRSPACTQSRESIVCAAALTPASNSTRHATARANVRPASTHRSGWRVQPAMSSERYFTSRPHRNRLGSV